MGERLKKSDCLAKGTSLIAVPGILMLLDDVPAKTLIHKVIDSKISHCHDILSENGIQSLRRNVIMIDI